MCRNRLLSLHIGSIARRHSTNLLLCVALFLPLLVVSPSLSLAQAPPGPQIHTGQETFDVVVDWQRGTVDNLLITNNEGGELRLAEHQTQGTFLSRPFAAAFALNAAGAFWRTDMPEGTELLLELRGRSTPPASTDDAHLQDNDGWGPWQPMIAGDARSQEDDGAFALPNVLAFPADTTHLQLRATLTTSIPNASAVLTRITIVYLNTVEGPAVAAGLPVSPILFGPETLTQRPMILLRPAWSGQRKAATRSHAPPRGVIIYQIAVVPGLYDTLPLLRALADYQTSILGWDDMAYHYIIDEQGMLYEGRTGGPTSSVPRLSGNDTAIHVALIGAPDAAPSEAAVATLTRLLAWAGEAYAIAPAGEHHVVNGDRMESLPNIVTHRDVVPDAADPGEPLRASIPTIRAKTDAAIIRSRWYFPEGNVRDYSERLVLYNPGSTPAEAAVGLLSAESTVPLVRSVTAPPEGHAELLINDILTGTESLSALVESSRPLIAERSMAFATDINVNAGIPELSRIWYFAEGSTDVPFETYLILFNPHSVDTTATLTYMKGDGTTVESVKTIPAGQRLVVTASNDLVGVGFGTRIIADYPIAAERTMRFGPDRTGMHMTPGTTRLSHTWYFAEGTTDYPFTMRLLALNPNDQPANTVITFMTPDGTSLKRQYAIPPTTRLVVDVNEVVPALGVATSITADRPLAVERALYFDPQRLEEAASRPTGVVTSTATTPSVLPSPFDRHERSPGDILTNAGTVSFGAMEPAYTWRFAYGSTRNTREYLLFINPSRGQAQVTVDFVLNDGSHEEQHIVMPAGSRYTLAVQDFYPDQASISATVRSTQKIVAERSLFAVGGNGGGSTSPGVPADE